jgi:hypothetical protein
MPGLRHEMKFSSFYSYDGTIPTVPTIVMFGFMSNSEDWHYINNTSLNMLIDGKPKDFGSMDRDGTVGRGYVLEHMSIYMPIEDFISIVNAKNVEMRLFSTEMSFSDEQLEALRDFASQMK